MSRRRAWLATCCTLLATPFAAPLWAQSEAESPSPTAGAAQKPDVEALGKSRAARRRLYPVSNRVSRYLGAAAEATDEGGPGEATALLEKLNLARLNTYERALVFRMMAFVAYSDGNAAGAIEAFENVLGEEILQIREEVRIRFNIAQLHAGQPNWRETIAALDRWFLWVEDPNPLAYYLKAIAHFQLDEMEPAQENAELAVDLSPEPREGWLQLLAALYVQGEDYTAATPVLEELVLRFPKRLYWVQLSLIYAALENYPHSLAVQQVAHAQGLLTAGSELRRLARSYLYGNQPYPAAQVLEKGLADGVIEPDAKAYELLANSWIGSREYEKSLGPLLQAATLSKTGDLYMRLGQVYLQREDWQQAAEMLDKAVVKGDLKEPGNALLLLGISHYNDARVGKARSYCARARKHEKTKPQAERWLTHLDTEAATAAGAESAKTAGSSEEPT